MIPIGFQIGIYMVSGYLHSMKLNKAPVTNTMLPELVYANQLELPHRILLHLWSWKRRDRRDRGCDERSQVISVIHIADVEIVFGAIVWRP